MKLKPRHKHLHILCFTSKLCWRRRLEGFKMSPTNYSGMRIFLIIILLFVIWQTLRCLPWLQSLQTADIDHGPSSSGVIIPVLVTVFYEALCPDSKNFIIKHLLPIMDKGSRLVTVSLVPYGKAKTEEDSFGNLSFSCQHGPVECLANKIHACGIDQISDSHLQVKYISCMIANNMSPEYIGEKCAKEMSISWEPILQCSKSREGSLLLKKHGEATHALRPKVSFIPTILLDEQQNNQAAILKNLFKEVCLMFKSPPAECLSPEELNGRTS